MIDSLTEQQRRLERPQWWLQCNACGWKLEPGAAAKNECPECGHHLNIHSPDQRKALEDR